MYSERILQLLAKKMGRAASDEELEELEQLMRRYPEHHLLLELLQSMEGEKLHKEPSMSEEKLVDESWSKLQLELNSRPAASTLSIEEQIAPVRTMRRNSWLQRAAVWGGIIVLAGSSWFLWGRNGKTALAPVAQKISQVAVPYGVPEKRLLPDGTIVWLNAGSSIRYAEDFIQQQREVYLDGEAYFNVKHDPEHPFIVHAGNIAVRALGTQFNVHAYRDENKIEATLISGKVQITMTDKPDQRIILEPNEKLTVTMNVSGKAAKKDKAGTEISFQVQEITPMASITAVKEVAWMQDKLAFQDEAFKELARRMERRYNKRIVFTDSLLEKERLNGVFENENIQKALSLLQMTTPFRFRFQGDSVILSRH